jgi:hypothetical protein
MKKHLLLLCLFLCCQGGGSALAADIYNLKLNAYSVGLGNSVLGNRVVGLAAGWHRDLLCASDYALSLSQARLAYDQYGYQALFSMPVAGRLSFRFDQIITQNTSYYRLLFNSDGTPIIDPVTNQQATELVYDTRIESLFGIGYGVEVIRGLILGLEGQAVNMKVGEDFAWGGDCSAGMGYYNYTDEERNYTDYSAGFLIKHLNCKWRAWHMPYREEQDRPVLEVGANWLLSAINCNFTACLQQRLEQNEVPTGRAGIEYNGFKPLAIRLGWDADHVNVGAGFEVGLGKEDAPKLLLDYAAITGGALYDANRITINVLF